MQCKTKKTDILYSSAKVSHYIGTKRLKNLSVQTDPVENKYLENWSQNSGTKKRYCHLCQVWEKK